MTNWREFIHPSEAILVAGSQNAKPQDRTLAREAIHTIQVLFDDGVQPVRFFDTWGRLGVSSIVPHPDNAFLLYLTTGNDLIELDLHTGKRIDIDVPDLLDVHEISIIDDVLWVANTGRDEVVAVDYARRRVRERISLYEVLKAGREKVGSGTTNEEWVERFHCNLVFAGANAQLYALVHHVTGWQLVRKIAEKLIKSHGNGGVINLQTGATESLNLKAPHSTRLVDGAYWIFDSGSNMINIYDTDWKLKKRLPTRGWGRGADVSGYLDYFYAGISATRKRYLGVIQGSSITGNVVQVYSRSSGASLGTMSVPDIEQINNVYVIKKEVARAMLALNVSALTS